MKRQGLRELIGKTIKLRPAVRRRWLDGSDLPSIDDDWFVTRSFTPNAVVRAVNSTTGHFIDLSHDNVYEFREPNFVVLKEQLTLRGINVDRDPLPDPRARYTPPVLRIRE
jgi:hypothetical protein